MAEKLVGKFAAIAVLSIFLFVAAAMILNMIHERKLYQEKAVEDIAASVSGVQMVLGPVLVIPYKVSVNTRDPQTKEMTRVIQERSYYMLPQELSVSADITVTPRKLGIYQAQLYAGKLNLSGSFGKIDLENVQNMRGFVAFDEPYFVLSIGDTRGINAISSLILNHKPFEFKEGILNSGLGKGVHVPVSVDALKLSEHNKFTFDLDLQGTQSLSVIPVGRKSDLSLKSNWPHPNFLGNTLPQTRDISTDGFSAEWQSSWFATNINDMFGDAKVPDLRYETLPAFSVSMVETVDQYQLNERSVKYAVLFIGLTFISFLIFEMMAQLKIHPVQYTLVGASLVMFYLLLLALSEHIGFDLAYALAALASSGLIGFYLCSVLKGVKRGASFAMGLLGLYGLLFLILHSEDMALLFGALLLFMILAGLMLLTRKVDWYQVAASPNMEVLKKKAFNTHRSEVKAPVVQQERKGVEMEGRQSVIDDEK